ncbi:choice-of-anchor B family protein [Nocardioides donggukensis]|uniref:Choice-of-anchor B family protein n=1 Tax=Nocardioides donggukensis TaxID=2774019 RepID=A0A927Q203_9ACTN|nr:choice-of-anchor B family protein [Nocardioides donggukensis]MBD8869909.1 choice-of-anchor B family protein [Nocardioides donggukensis]
MRLRTITAATAAVILGAAGTLATSSPGSAHPDHDGTGKEAGFDLVVEDPSPAGVPMQRMSDIRCEDDMAGIFPCHKTDLKSFVPLTEFDSVWANDVWGWTDPQTGREYALVGLFEGTGFVDVTNPSDPTVLGVLPTHTAVGSGGVWRDIKVYRDHAYIVSENAGHGMQVFDLTRLRGATERQTWTEDNWLGGFGQVHNLAVNEDSGMAYVVGARRDTTACPGVNGGPILIDLDDPANPEVAGCYGGDGYTHDIQCVTYHGPDSDYTGREICSASNEDTVTVLDATDPTDVRMIARVPYDTASYTHQGWFTEDHAYFLMGDELDELRGTVEETTTYIFDMKDLDDPQLTGTGSSGLDSIDHNIFIKDKVVYESNYTSGLRMFDSYKLDQGRMKQIGWFDSYPQDDETKFAGTWSNYPYFDSGNVVMTGTEEGLFVVRPRVKSSAPRR